MATEVVKIVDPGEGAGHDYHSLSLWEAGENANLVTGDLIAVAKCRSTGGVADTTQLVIDGWTTDATRYIKIWTDPAEEFRHNGTYQTTKYRLELATSALSYKMVEIYNEETQIYGLQFSIDDTAVSGGDCCVIYPRVYSGEQSFFLSESILKRADTGTSAVHGIQHNQGNGIVTVRNCIAYDFGPTGTWSRTFALENAGTFNAYNCTIQNSKRGFYQTNGTFVVKNCIAQDCGDGFEGTFDNASDYNSSDIADDAPGANSQTGSVVFVNEAGDDFHLDSTDTVAINNGVDLNAVFTVDIDNVTRPTGAGTWDIGADEYVAAGGLSWSGAGTLTQSGVINRQFAITRGQSGAI